MPEHTEPSSTQPYEQWHSKVWEAYSRYMEATATFGEILKQHQQRRIWSADSACALTQAHQAGSAAYREYTRVLRIFAELTLRKPLLENLTQE